MSAPALFKFGFITVDKQDIPLSADGLPAGMPTDYGVQTIGWGVLAWAEYMLIQPDGARAGDPWSWTEDQARIVAWWYAVDSNGRWVFTRSQIVLPKGAGKSPLAAALSCCSLAADVVFDGFDAHGEAVGRPQASPYVQLAAVSQDQTDNTMSLVLAMLREGAAANEIPGLDPGLTRVRTRNGILKPVTASAPSREGGRTTDSVLDETHLWNATNGGIQLAATIRRNLGKMNGRSLETTNCWIPGENSVAEATANFAAKILEGTAVNTGLMRYHPSADVDDLADEDAVRAALKELYRCSPWIDVERVINEIYDLGTDPQDSRRFYLNQITHAVDSWISEPEWRACINLEDPVLEGDTIVVGFDGSRHRSRGVADSTALVGCRVSDGRLFLIACWEQPEGPTGADWWVPTAQVQAEVAETFARFNVVGMYADPAADWRSYVAAWEAQYNDRLTVKVSSDHPMEWWFGGPNATKTVRATEQLHSAVIHKELSHDGGATMTRHFLNARRRISRVGIQIAKDNPESPRKIDVAVASVLAWQARLNAVAAGVGIQTKKKPGKLYRF